MYILIKYIKYNKIFIYKIDLNIQWYKKVLFSIMSKYIIYKIYCDDCDFIYVGSTKNFTRRKQQHKINCNQTDKSNMKLYKTINEYGGWNNWKMICIEECDETIISRRQAEQKEEEWRVKLKPQIKTRPSLNIVHPNTKKNAPPVTSLQTQLNTQNQANSSSSNASNNQRVFSNLGILSQGGNLNVMGTMAGPSVRRGGGCGCGR